MRQRRRYLGVGNGCSGARYIVLLDDGRQEVCMIPVAERSSVLAITVCPEDLPLIMLFDSLDDASLFAEREAKERKYPLVLPKDLKKRIRNIR